MTLYILHQSSTLRGHTKQRRRYRFLFPNVMCKAILEASMQTCAVEYRLVAVGFAQYAMIKNVVSVPPIEGNIGSSGESAFRQLSRKDSPVSPDL